MKPMTQKMRLKPTEPVATRIAPAGKNCNEHDERTSRPDLIRTGREDTSSNHLADVLQVLSTCAHNSERPGAYQEDNTEPVDMIAQWTDGLGRGTNDHYSVPRALVNNAPNGALGVLEDSNVLLSVLVRHGGVRSRQSTRSAIEALGQDKGRTSSCYIFRTPLMRII
jgi:hypothetical protein